VSAFVSTVCACGLIVFVICVCVFCAVCDTEYMCVCETTVCIDCVCVWSSESMCLFVGV